MADTVALLNDMVINMANKTAIGVVIQLADMDDMVIKMVINV